jgi:hypothetical protein
VYVVMDGMIRVRSVVWCSTAVVLAVVCTLLVTEAWSASAAPGDQDSTFVPTAGCRLADTRPAPNTVGPRSVPLGAEDVYEVTVRGANGNCTGALAIPTDAVGVALNVTAVNATATSNIRIYPADLVDVPVLSNLNVVAGAPPTPNKVDVKLSSDGKIRVFNFRGTVNVFIDVVGYYTNSTLQELSQRVSALESMQSFVEFAGSSTIPSLTTTPTSYLDVAVTAPADGHVTVNFTTIIGSVITGGEPAAKSACSVYRSTEIPATAIADLTPGAAVWGPATSADDDGSLSGVNRFDISAGQTVTYSLACEEYYGSSFLLGRAMTATFTPVP